MRFSLIIPIYNSALFLRKCLDSFVNQDYNDYQLILIDDGSTDESFAICEEYAKQHENIIAITQTNSGPSIARNKGIEMATGDYLLFADSDDWAAGNYFSRLDEALRDNPVDILMFGRHGSNDGDITFDNRLVEGRENVLEYILNSYLNSDYNSGCNKAYSKKLYYNTELRFLEHTVVEEDLLFNLQAIDMAQSIKTIDDVLYFYNQRDVGSVTTKYNPDKFGCKLTAYNKELYYARKWSCKELENFYKEKLLVFISAAINNMLYKECHLSFGQKREEIKRFFNQEEVLECVQSCETSYMRAKIMRFFIKHKMYTASYLVHKAGRCLKRR